MVVWSFRKAPGVPWSMACTGARHRVREQFVEFCMLKDRVRRRYTIDEIPSVLASSYRFAFVMLDL